MRGLLSAKLRAAKSSYVATALAIALAVAFLLTCLGLAGGMKVKMAHNLAHNVTGAEIVASIKPNSSVDVKEGCRSPGVGNPHPLPFCRTNQQAKPFQPQRGAGISPATL